VVSGERHVSASLLELILNGVADDVPPLLISVDELSAFRERLGPKLLQQIREAGLDDKVLFVIRDLHVDTKRRPTHSSVRPVTRRQLLQDAKTLKAAEKAVHHLLQFELPYNSEDALTKLRGLPLLGNEIEDLQNGFELPTFEEAATELQTYKRTIQTFSDADWQAIAPETAARWKRLIEMNATEYYAHFAYERARARRPFWLPPFRLSKDFTSLFGDRRVGGQAGLTALASLLADLAEQAHRAAERLTAHGS